MRFASPLLEGRLIQRYKRFLADVSTTAGVVTMHCPNTGAMTGCAEPGTAVWYSTSTNPKRKYANTWEIGSNGAGDRFGINSANANGIVAEAVTEGALDALRGFGVVQREPAIPDERGRFDLLMENGRGERVWAEVKSVTLQGADGLGMFPDARSERARKHVEALARRVIAGDRAMLVFCVQHTGICRVRPADTVDPAYGEALRAAAAAGVEVVAYGCTISPAEIRVAGPLPVEGVA